MSTVKHKYGYDEYGRYFIGKDDEKFQVEPYPYLNVINKIMAYWYIIRWYMGLGFLHETNAYCHECYANYGECHHTRRF